MIPHALIYPGIRAAVGDWQPGEIEAMVSGLVAGAIVSYLLYRFVHRLPWPRPFRVRFVFLHVAGFIAFAASWIALSIAIEALFTGSLMETRTGWRLVHLPGELPQISFLLYAVIVSITYSIDRRAQAAHAAAEASRAQLAALRAQLHPHFLFNALHTVVQLIQIDPARATEAAELVASLLRRTLEDDRDEVSLEEEWTFVSRYLEIERLRFGDRLKVQADLDPALRDERVPSFALQTLVENAVRHGAAHRTEPTEIVIEAAAIGPALKLFVWNSADNTAIVPAENGAGTGLSRLRDRLSFLYGNGSLLATGPDGNGGYRAALSIPRGRES